MTFSIRVTDEAGVTSTINAASVTISDVVATRAARIADMMEIFGACTFSAFPDGSNPWGAWPSDYSIASTSAAANWITNGSGLNMLLREYHFDQWTANQSLWMPDVAAQTGCKFILCPGMSGMVGTATAGMLSLAAQSASSAKPWLLWLEGCNEPNGDGKLTSDQALNTQAAIWNAGSGLKVLGPSIVTALPYPENDVTKFFSPAQLATLKAKLNLGSVHYYPSQNPAFSDGSRRSSEIDDVATGLRSVFGPLLGITEWNPTLYNQHGHTDDAHACYYAAIYLLEAFRCEFQSAILFSLLDFGAAYKTGLFPLAGGVDPRPLAWVFRALYTLTGDLGATKRTFSQGSLPFAIHGLPPSLPGLPRTGGQFLLLQNSAGVFFLFLWNSQQDPGGAAVPVTVDLGLPVHSAREHNVSTGLPSSLTAIQSLAGVSSITSQLDASVRLITIHVAPA